MHTHRVFLYVTGVAALAAVLLACGWRTAGFETQRPPLEVVGFWLAFCLAAECFFLETPSGEGMISMSSAANVASVFLLPLPQAITVAALSVGLADLMIHRRAWTRALFNSAQTSISIAAASFVLGAAHGSHAFLIHPVEALLVPVVFFVCNTGQVAGVIALHSRTTFWSAWRDNYGNGYYLLTSAVLSVMAFGLVVGIESLGSISGLLVLLPLYFVRSAYHRIVRDRRQFAALRA